MTESHQSSRADLTPLDVVFMGTPAFAAESLRSLLDGPHNVVAVVTRPDKPRGRGKKLQPSPVKKLALSRGIRVAEPSRGRDPQLIGLLRELSPDISVVVAYGCILPADVITVPRLGTINAHASLLPRLRGAAPIQRAILEGFETTGITIMCINERMDAGDIMMSESLSIPADATTGLLTAALSTMAARLLPEALDRLARGDARFVPQDESQATYAPPIRRDETSIDWSRTCEYVDRQVRAFVPNPGAFTFDGERRLKIVAAHPGRGADYAGGNEAGKIMAVTGDAVEVACGDGVLVVRELQPEGGKPMAAADYLRGYHQDGAPVRLTATACSTRHA